jgi:hypothetical protein
MSSNFLRITHVKTEVYKFNLFGYVNSLLFQAVADPIRRAIYTQKVSPPGRPKHFLPLEDGIERTRTSPFAFHLELGPGYKYISDTFLEEEKCNLQAIVFLTEIPKPFVAVSKKTPFKEILTVGYVPHGAFRSQVTAV